MALYPAAKGVSFSSPNLKAGGGQYIPTNKKNSNPGDILRGMKQQDSMNESLQNALNSGTMGLVPKVKVKPQTPLQKQKVNPAALSGALKAKKK